MELVANSWMVRIVRRDGKPDEEQYCADEQEARQLLDFDRFVQQDFTQFDDSNLTAIMDAPDGTKKLDGVANGIPDKFRFSWDTSIETTANYDLR